MIFWFLNNSTSSAINFSHYNVLFNIINVLHASELLEYSMFWNLHYWKHQSIRLLLPVWFNTQTFFTVSDSILNTSLSHCTTQRPAHVGQYLLPLLLGLCPRQLVDLLLGAELQRRFLGIQEDRVEGQYLF